MPSKVALQARISEDLDIELRAIAAKHRKRPNAIIEAMIRHCANNRHFIEKLTAKKEEIDYPI